MYIDENFKALDIRFCFNKCVKVKSILYLSLMKRSLELKTIFILYFIIIKKFIFCNFLFNGTKNIQNNEYIYISA